MDQTLASPEASAPAVLAADSREALVRLGHELRTPLTVISVAGHLLEESVDERGRDVLQHLRKAADRLTDVVEDLLLMRRLSGPQRRLERRPVRLDELAREAAKAAEPRAQAAEIRLSVETDGPAPVEAEPELVTRALAHLLGNALTFSPGGGRVVLRVEAFQRGFEASVADQGPGVPAAELAALYRPFYQAAPLMTRSVGGLGLGLTLVRLIAESHRGAVTAYSRPGRGSRFGLWLPAAPRA